MQGSLLHSAAIAGAGAVAVVALALVSVAAPDDRSGPLAAVFPPWVTPAAAAQAVVSAGGLLVDAGRGVIVTTAARPGFAGRLREAGAWFVAPPSSLAGCAPRSGKAFSAGATVSPP